MGDTRHETGYSRVSCLASPVLVTRHGLILFFHKYRKSWYYHTNRFIIPYKGI